MFPNQASSLPPPIPTGRATQGVGAPDGASAPAASQAGDSVFDDLMAVLAPVAAGPVTDPEMPADATQSGATQSGAIQSGAIQSDATPSDTPQAGVVPPVAAQTSAAVALPQLLATLDLPTPADAGAPAEPVPEAEASDDRTANPTDAAKAQSLPRAGGTALPEVQAPSLPVAEEAATPAVRPAAIKGAMAKTAAKPDATHTPGDQDTNALPAVAILDTVQQPIVPVAAIPAQPQQTAGVSAPQSGAPAASTPDPAAQAPYVAPDATSSSSSAPAANNAVPSADAATPQPGAAPVTAPVTAPAQAPVAQKTDVLTGGLKAARKALATETDAQTVPAPHSQAASGFMLQAQAETPGSYSATGAQTAGTTQGGSNLARATVETLSNMAVQINRKLSDGNTKFAVELHPADLGKVEVTLTIARDGTTTAHLKFDTPVTAAAFQAREGELRHQLAQSGLSFDSGSLTFSSRDGGDTGGGFNQSFAQTQQDQQSQNRQSQARAFQNAAAIADAADNSAAIDAGLLAMRAGGASSTLALNLIV